MPLRVASLHTYPVKSLRGIDHEEVEVDGRGPRRDREWMVVDADGRFVTQRELPAMARLRVAHDDVRLHLAAMDAPPLSLPIDVEGKSRQVVCWRDSCAAVDCGDEAAAWLGERLGRPLRLVRMQPGFRRRVNPRRSPEPAHTGFADGYPFLIVTRASLAALNRELPAALPMDRFRPNVVVEGGEPWEEDRWRRIRLGGLILDVVKPCERCAIPATDQRTGERGREPLATLARLRRSEAGVLFGVNAVHRSRGRLARGDALEVLETGEGPNLVGADRAD